MPLPKHCINCGKPFIGEGVLCTKCLNEEMVAEKEESNATTKHFAGNHDHKQHYYKQKEIFYV